jgi:hypothetical protein
LVRLRIVRFAAPSQGLTRNGTTACHAGKQSISIYFEPAVPPVDEPLPAPPAPPLPLAPPVPIAPEELEVPLVPDVPEVSAARRSQPAKAKLITAAPIIRTLGSVVLAFMGIPFNKSYTSSHLTPPLQRSS